MSNRIQLGHADQLYVRNLYLCVYLYGRNTDDEPCYAYFGIFLDTFLTMWADIQDGQAVNPKDHQALVLSRGIGLPSPDVQDFMRRKFSFRHAPEEVVLEISRPESRFSSQLPRKEKLVPKSSHAEAEKRDDDFDEDENDFPFAADSITETRIGSAHAEISTSQEDAIYSLMQKLINTVNDSLEIATDFQIRVLHK